MVPADTPPSPYLLEQQSDSFPSFQEPPLSQQEQPHILSSVYRWLTGETSTTDAIASLQHAWQETKAKFTSSSEPELQPTSAASSLLETESSLSFRLPADSHGGLTTNAAAAAASAASSSASRRQARPAAAALRSAFELDPELTTTPNPVVLLSTMFASANMARESFNGTVELVALNGTAYPVS